MTTHNHTAIATGAAANAATINTPLGTIDAAIGNLATLTTTAKTSAVAAINEHETQIGDLTTLTTTAKTSAVAAINEIASGAISGPAYRVGLNGAYTTVSAALAAITDASASKIYTLIVDGTITEAATVVPKSYVNVLGMPGAKISVAISGAGYGFDFNSVTNTTWRGLTLERAGVVASGVTVVLVRGTCTRTVRFENCTMVHSCTGTGSDGYGFYVADSATPVLDGCTITGSATGANGIAMLISSTGAVEVTGSTITGGSGGAGSHGVYFTNSTYGEFYDCIIVGGGGGANCNGIRADGRQAKLERCTVIGGSGGTGCSAIAIGNAGAILANQTIADVPIERVTTSAITATTTLTLQASKPHQINDILINCSAAAGGGITVSVGTTLAGTDIINAFAVTSTGTKYPPMGSGARALLAAGATLYVTVSGAGTATFTLATTISISYATCYGLSLNGVAGAAGRTRINNCTILSNCASPACSIDAHTVAANLLSVQNTIFRPLPALTASPVAVTCASYWWNAPFYDCIFDGGVTNLRPATPIHNGSCVEVQATPENVPDSAIMRDYYLRRWRVQVAKVQQAVATENANVVLLGDSWAYDDLIGSVTRTLLQTAYGDGGGGFISAFGGVPLWGSLAATRANFTGVDVTTPATAYGVDGNHIISTNDTATWEIGGSAFDTAIIHYIKFSGGGTFRYKVGVGGAWVEVATDNATTVFATVTITGPGTALYFDILSQGSGVILCGVDWRKNGNAVRLHRVGNGGIKASEYAGLDATIWSAGLAALEPDAVLILLGTNEMNQNIAPGVMTTNLTTLIARIRAAVTPSPDVILIAPSDNGAAGKTYTMAQYAAEIRYAARLNRCGFISFYDLLSPYSGDWITEGLYYNTLHPDAIGGRMLGNVIYKTLAVS